MTMLEEQELSSVAGCADAQSALPRQTDKGSATPSDEAMARWLDEAARYFEHRPTHGEDSAHWANVYNATNARAIGARLRALTGQSTEPKESSQ
jgi:hypothetical protein